MAFAQPIYREGLRDIEACLRTMRGKVYQMGFRGKVARSTLADANESRDWRIYADVAQVLIRIARPLYAQDPIGVDLDHTLYALDSTTIDLCLSLFTWAKFRTSWTGATSISSGCSCLSSARRSSWFAPSGRKDNPHANSSRWQASGRRFREPQVLRSLTLRPSSDLGVRFFAEALTRPQHLVAT